MYIFNNYLKSLIIFSTGLCNAIKCFQCYRISDIVIINDRKECQDPFTGDGVHTSECNTACSKRSTILANGTTMVNSRGCMGEDIKCECDDKDKGEERECCLKCDDKDLCNTSSLIVKKDLIVLLAALLLISVIFNLCV
ncbi:uncharacterized protein LOC117117455 [Anneissia japonica]|uniref:uncharacterized protein LOC117117455 n=1 Tax=Anneissia japonica TaxID=1529436 RepID=UPI00142588D4|nr:uncharacterized protein LOC117117455 [Anneissia japonica]